jgi:Pyridoxal-phosphate dependent enzyme
MTIIPNTLALIGNTPLVKLEGPSAEAGCIILGKCEYANPGASVKDRAALYIIEDAERSGRLLPGGTVVEGTAGNTGIGIALVANAKGYKTIIVMERNWFSFRQHPSPIPAISFILRGGSRRRQKAQSGPISLTISPIGGPISTQPQKKSGNRQTARLMALPALREPAVRLPALVWG